MLSIKNIDRICIVIILLIALGSGYLTSNLVVKQKRLLRQENQLLSKRIKDMNLAEISLKQIRTVLDNARRELKALNERIPEKAEIGALIHQLDAKFRERKITLAGFMPQPPQKEKLYTKVPLRLTFTGTFNNIYHLLDDLETMNRILVVEQISVKGGQSGDENTVDLTANVFERGA